MPMNALPRRRWMAWSIASAIGLAAGGLAFAAPMATDIRELGAFDEVVWDAAGELLVEQSHRERLSIEAEPAVLAKIVAEVQQRRLRIGFMPGSIQTQRPIRFRLETRQLLALETRGSGSVRIAPLSTPKLSLVLDGSVEIQLAQLSARSLEVRLAGAGNVAIGGGQVDTQRVAIDGSGNYVALRLASRHAEVSIGGSGEVRLAVSERLKARIAGSGELLYRGHPQIAQSITGAGSVRPANE
jgi:putative autotransporter adhesin-like protein